MKKITYGNKKGYIVAREEFNARMAERIPVLGNPDLRITYSVHYDSNCIKIWYEACQRSKIADGIVLEKFDSSKESVIHLSKTALGEIFGIKERIVDFEVKRKVGENRFENINRSDLLIDDKNLFCIITTDERPLPVEFIAELP
jgi:hypothetical protein